MYHLVYASSAAYLFSPSELTDLLTVSRRNNTSLGVTGLLLYKDGNFMQVLEGERETIESLYQKIEADRRHHGCLLLLKGETEKRQFADWAMAFRDLNSARVQDVEGYSTFLDSARADPAAPVDPTRVQRLLQTFRERM